jgi:peptidoglycan/xylan/chitin deacetylase (PgdA/CDA1 family)
VLFVAATSVAWTMFEVQPGEIREPPTTVAVVDGRTVAVVGSSPVVRDALEAARVVPRDGALISAGGRVLDPHADPAVIALDGRRAQVTDALHPGAEIRVDNGATSLEPLDARVQAALPSGLPRVENAVWRPGTPGLDQITVGRQSGEVASRRTLLAAGAAQPDPDRVVALTFDDGPSPEWTPFVLAILRNFGTKATFCVIGYNVARYPDLVRQIAIEGHTLCNHTAHHALLDQLPVDAITAEISEGAAGIRALTGHDPQFLRAPGGRLSDDVIDIAHRHGHRVVGWNVDPEDYRRPAPEVIRDRILGSVRPGAVVVLHDGGGDRSHTVTMLTELLLLLNADGYRVVALQPSVTPPQF